MRAYWPDAAWAPVTPLQRVWDEPSGQVQTSIVPTLLAMSGADVARLLICAAQVVFLQFGCEKQGKSVCNGVRVQMF